jgi:hypothetical protein
MENLSGRMRADEENGSGVAMEGGVSESFASHEEKREREPLESAVD